MAFVPEFIGNSVFAKNTNGIIKSISESPTPVFLFGERGTGKRLFSQKVHFYTAGSLKNFFEINCRVLKDEEICRTINVLINLGQQEIPVTLFINNINFLSKELQIQFLNNYLNSISENKIKLITSSDVQIENNTDLNFNADLYFRLSVVKLNFLPLRQRPEDIIPIAEYYFNKFKKDSGYRFEKISDSALKLLESNFWKGNCDELINSVQRAFIVGSESIISAQDLGFYDSNENQTEKDIFSEYDSMKDKTLKTVLDDYKRKYLIKVLIENNWNQTKTAKILGIQRTYVVKLISDLNIKKSDYKL